MKESLERMDIGFLFSFLSEVEKGVGVSRKMSMPLKRCLS